MKLENDIEIVVIIDTDVHSFIESYHLWAYFKQGTKSRNGNQ